MRTKIIKEILTVYDAHKAHIATIYWHLNHEWKSRDVKIKCKQSRNNLILPKVHFRGYVLNVSYNEQISRENRNEYIDKTMILSTFLLQFLPILLYINNLSPACLMYNLDWSYYIVWKHMFKHVFITFSCYVYSCAIGKSEILFDT